jgi:hypothetical protein
MEQPGKYQEPAALPPKHPIYKPQTPNPTSTSKAVNFVTNPSGEKKREKYLTAKYGAHQMALIRKRLKVEMFDQLQELCESEVSFENIIENYII